MSKVEAQQMRFAVNLFFKKNTQEQRYEAKKNHKIDPWKLK